MRIIASKIHSSFHIDLIHSKIPKFKIALNIQYLLFITEAGVKSDIDREEWYREFPLEECQHFWKNYVVRLDGFSQRFKYGDQQKYGAAMHQTVLIAAKYLLPQGFRATIAFLALQRFTMSGNVENYGKQRTTTMQTHCNGLYAGVEEVFCSERKEYASLKRGVNLSPEQEWVFLVKKYESVEITGTIDGQEIPLTQVIRGDMRDTTGYYGIDDPKFIRVRHICDLSKYWKIIEPHLIKLFDSARKADLQIKKMRLLGQLYWWICHVKPWFLGDPSIAELLFKAIAAEAGKDLGPWKKKLIPWVEVIKKPTPILFGDHFSTLFENQ